MTGTPRPFDQHSYRKALAMVPTLPRIVFLLHAVDGFDYEKIAFRIGDDVREVERHFATALKYLVRELDGGGSQ